MRGGLSTSSSDEARLPCLWLVVDGDDSVDDITFGADSAWTLEDDDDDETRDLSVVVDVVAVEENGEIVAEDDCEMEVPVVIVDGEV